MLPDAKVRLLERTFPDWTWNPISDSWFARFELLQQYVDREGHPHVHERWVEDGVALGVWIKSQRIAYGRGKLNPDYRAAIEALPDWTWSQAESTWRRQFNVLRRFAEREGNARPSKEHVEDGFALGAWAGNQRTAFKRGRLGSERARRLEALPGWVWGVRRESSG
jgi:hypothetical protein